MSFVDYLQKKNVISESQLNDVLQKSNGDIAKAEEIMVSEMGVSVNDFLSAKAEYYQIPVKKLDDTKIPFEILKYVPEDSAKHYMFVPLAVTDGFLEVGIVNPEDIEARDALNFISTKEDLPFKLFLISYSEFQEILKVYKGISGEVTQALTELESEMKVEKQELKSRKKETVSSSEEEGEDGENSKNVDGSKIVEDAPITKIVGTILRYAVEGGASDVHIERLREKVRVRFRVDGVLNTSLVLPPTVHQAVVARVKILSKLRLDEKRKPQDGRFSANLDGRKVDFRVSTFPSYYGEKVVMRILDQQKGIKSVDEIGLSQRDLDLVKEAIKRPYGMILVSGPTGSGKSTTLYSLLGELDTEGKNILSLEDPVEYSIEGVSQSQVRADIGYTFASGLRTTLRQDPDIIMVGEIRDSETAKLAIQASLTGHLVLSTIHTNTAAGIVPRLIDMGVDPYLIPPTLILGIGQRLVRTLCPGSGETFNIEGSYKAMLDAQFKDLPEEFKKKLPEFKEAIKIKPTPECPSGTRGRTAVFEVFKMDRDIEDVILKNPVESEIYDVVRKKGMLTMKEDAIMKALKKEIPFEEINTL